MEMNYEIRVLGVAAFVLTAGCGWALYVKELQRMGSSFLLAAVSGLSLLALWPYGEPRTVARQPSTTIGQLLAADRLPPTVDSEPSTANGFVASTIKKKYHLPDCFYVRMMKHDKPLMSREDAEAAGLTLCEECERRLTSLARALPAQADTPTRTGPESSIHQE